MRAWAKDHGINKVEADTALAADRLVKTIVLREQLEAEHASAERRSGDVDKASDKLLEETGSEQSAEITRSTEEIATHLAALNAAIVKARKAEDDLRKRLAIISTYGRDLSEKGRADIQEWISVLIPLQPAGALTRSKLFVSEPQTRGPQRAKRPRTSPLRLSGTGSRPVNHRVARFLWV